MALRRNGACRRGTPRRRAHPRAAAGARAVRLIWWPDQRAAGQGTHRHELGAAIGEIQHLQRAGVLDQALHVLAHQRFRADRDVDRGMSALGQFGVLEVFNFAQARDLGRRLVERIRDLAGNQVDLVAGGHRDDQVGILRTRMAQHAGQGGMSDDGADIQTLGQLAQLGLVEIDHGDVAVLRRQRRRHGSAHLPGAEDQDLHVHPAAASPRSDAASNFPANSANRFRMLVAADNDLCCSEPARVSSSAAAL
jgi:hypothetical protein